MTFNGRSNHFPWTKSLINIHKCSGSYWFLCPSLEAIHKPHNKWRQRKWSISRSLRVVNQKPSGKVTLPSPFVSVVTYWECSLLLGDYLEGIQCLPWTKPNWRSVFFSGAANVHSDFVSFPRQLCDHKRREREEVCFDGLHWVCLSRLFATPSQCMTLRCCL